MKDINIIKQTMGMKIKKEMKNGFGGSLFPIEYKNGKAKVIQDYDKVLNFIFSWACGWEHLSVSTTVKTPTWEQMCKMKDIFWNEDEVCMQLHPAKENYINNMPYCLHIWKPIKENIPTPPNIMVGLRPNKIEKDLIELLKFSKEMNIPIDEEVLEEMKKSLGMNIDIDKLNKLKEMDGAF